jgi:hypothetical protein
MSAIHVGIERGGDSRLDISDHDPIAIAALSLESIGFNCDIIIIIIVFILH